MAIDLRDSSTLYTRDNCLFGQALKLLLQHKGMLVQHAPCLPDAVSHCELPAFVHNKFLVSGRIALFEFLCERFPDPAVMPLDPTNRAIHRMVIVRIVSNWYILAKENADNTLIQQINESKSAISSTKYFLSKTLGAIDIFLFPLLIKYIDNPALHPTFKNYALRLQNKFLQGEPPCSSSSSSSF